jgi:hypothetical protein
MEVDAPANTESNVTPDRESDSESVVLESAKLMPTFYPQATLNPNPQDEIAGSSGIVQTDLNDQTGIIKKRIAVCDLILEI